MADDLRDYGGAFTRDVVKTPNLDRLRVRGVTFERAYVQYPVCNPSRCSMLTGLRAEQTDIVGNDVRLRERIPDVVTLPQLCKNREFVEMFLDEAGVKANHIPYKGVGPMVTDLLGGQVDFGVLALPSIQAHLKSGALRAIGTSSKTRLAAAPEIPTFVEQGLSNYVVEGWFAVIGPKNLPAADVKRIHSAFTAAFASAEVKESMGKQGNSITISTPEVATAFFKSEVDKYAKLVKKAGVKLD